MNITELQRPSRPSWRLLRNKEVKSLFQLEHFRLMLVLDGVASTGAKEVICLIGLNIWLNFFYAMDFFAMTLNN